MNRIKSRSFREILSKYTIYFIFAALVVIISFLSENFLTISNLKNILQLESPRGIIALGMGIVMISQGIDLSVGSVAALSSVIAGSMVQDLAYSGRILNGVGPYSTWIAILAGLLVGVIIGALNGIVVGYIKLPPFIATLGTQSIATGLAQIYTNASPVSSLSDEFKAVSQTQLGPIPLVVVYFVVFAVLAWVLLNKTKLGKRVYAIGCNVNSAKVVGINIERTNLVIYIISGILAAFAGILMAGRAGAGNCTLGKSYELDAVSASAIGGVSMTGGVGTLGGIIIGILLLGVLNNGMLLLGISSYFQQIIKGIIILVAVTIDTRKTAKRN